MEAPASLSSLPFFVQHGADAAVFHAGEHDVAFFDDTGLHQHGGDAAAATVKAGFNHNPASHAGGRCGQLQHFGLDEDFVEQVVDASPLFAET